LHAPIKDDLTFALRGFVVESQIFNLIPDLSFDQNSCVSSLNEQGHYRHLQFKTFPMVTWGPNLVLVYLFNEGSKYLGLLHECNSQSGSALGSHWAQIVTLSPTLESVFHFWTHIFGLMCLCIPHLIINLILGLQYFISIFTQNFF
jgi:hypothetical protein